jgi:ferredoxin
MAGNRIYYFSATGNSLHAARTLADALQDCSVEPIQKGVRLPEGMERIGIVFPVFWWGLPANIIEFASSLDFSGNEGAYVFAVATCGGMQGDALGQLNRILSQKGQTLKYSAAVRMIGNYVIEYNVPADPAKRLQKAQTKLDAAAMDIAAEKESCVPAGIPGSKKINDKFQKRVADMDANFTVSDACVHCGTCARVCPAGNIRMKDGSPVFLHHCENCLSCLHWCPQKAIDYGNKTKDRGRYHHPLVNLADIDHK